MGPFKEHRTVGRPDWQKKAGREAAKPPGTQVRGERRTRSSERGRWNVRGRNAARSPRKPTTPQIRAE
ncbi:hypothetical protein NDU88_004066 [Pleurodeles waltl]|uniref:Uncharacterized protein n=1 Tax=Pleurodeles waltl TaxID=8319 RepID=A0AAV7MSF7_PLEWA|nr:hypothetical protein NDU88_004066 [Pleurodeles waltl]